MARARPDRDAARHEGERADRPEVVAAATRGEQLRERPQHEVEDLPEHLLTAGEHERRHGGGDDVGDQHPARRGEHAPAPPVSPAICMPSAPVGQPANGCRAWAAWVTQASERLVAVAEAPEAQRAR